MSEKQYEALMEQAKPSPELIQATKQRMRASITTTRKESPMNKSLLFKRLAPIAACLVLAIAGVAVIPGLLAQRPVDLPPTQALTRQPTQKQNPGEEIQQIILPSYLSGQEVRWESAGSNGDSDGGWSVFVDLSFVLQMEQGQTDMLISGSLADGRKIRVDVEVVGHSPEVAEGADELDSAAKAASSRITIAIQKTEPNPALEVGSTLMEFNLADETGTTTYRMFIAAIE